MIIQELNHIEIAEGNSIEGAGGFQYGTTVVYGGPGVGAGAGFGTSTTTGIFGGTDTTTVASGGFAASFFGGGVQTAGIGITFPQF
ncbi:hypothetical protein Xen7305DRAFT_00035360 [Xenococcus sp. PCC 7305]|uniref:hypothetical protein n=1 Tax=Xenococcus sp. PCC 7305 TaxID=102125 RepID=UPI0002ABC8CA|nr:hypothetical protein [Xenococcus sp. PCC 7305]ELS03812.1 hypothetical protein Xen7305DRAFT_00035360 [Xenococcus sp. PCC 7305]